PQRVELSDEVHARPPAELDGAQRISYVAMVCDPGQHAGQWSVLRKLVSSHGHELPVEPQGHLLMDLGRFRARYERHNEFSRLMIIADGAGVPFKHPAIALLPEGWLARLPGELIMAAHVEVVAARPGRGRYDELARRYFGGNVLVGAAVSGGAATVMTDFRIHDDGFSRILTQNHSATPRQAGRVVQRMLEIDTYRMMALLTFPAARKLGPGLSRSESELSLIADAMAHETPESETDLLARLLKLEAEIESRYAESQFRFGAAAAYYELVRQRIEDLREERLPGLQMISEFMERRLAPAMATCRSAERRLENLSERISRATQLLSTRIDAARQKQNQDLLATMARRAKLQLRLQQTVEGLSVAAITYYLVGIIGYAAKGLSSSGVPLKAEIVTGASIPFVLAAVALGIRRIRRIMGLHKE
ncbi:MAG: DUF3422 family protein, partial [Hyphomicrobiales bacterium]